MPKSRLLDALRAAIRAADGVLFATMMSGHARRLEREARGCESVLDVGCGSHSPIGLFSSRPRRIVGVDAFEPSLAKSRAAGIHDEFVLMDVREIGSRFPPGSFDAVFAVDLIEHLAKADALRLIRAMERIARRRVVLTTPNGFLSQGALEANDWQIHRSGWTVGEMRRLGYKVGGLDGWRPLRREEAEIRWSPRFFWRRVSLLTQLAVARVPGRAFSLICVKELWTGERRAGPPRISRNPGPS